MANTCQMESFATHDIADRAPRRRGQSTSPRRLALAAALSLAALAAGCGSTKTETVSVTSAPASAPRSSQARPTTTATRSAGTTPAPARNAPTAASHSGPEPAFAQPSGGQAGAAAAVAVMKAHGFTPNDPSQYHSSQTLAVLVGTHAGSGDGYGQQAFFFVNGRYIGTDTSAPSATVRVLAQSDTEVTLGYPLYRARDPLCCPSGGQAKVRFQLNNGRLTPLDPIPPASSPTGLSRQ